MKKTPNIKTFNCKYISDGINEDYKLWTKKTRNDYFTTSARVFIQSPTGTGKTYFILNTLAEFAATEGRNILYLSNRNALTEQLRKESYEKFKPVTTYNNSDRIETKVFQHREYPSTITISNYQSVISDIKNSNYTGLIQNTYYIICDEAHFFLEDALFNSRTGKVLMFIQKYFKDSVWIFLSATLKEFATLFNLELFKHKRTPYYADYQIVFDEFYYENLWYYENNITIGKYRPFIYENYSDIIKKIVSSNPDEKWLIFVSSKLKGRELYKYIKDNTKRKVLFLSAENKQNPKRKEFLNQESFNENILITTKVLDNGVNIKDRTVKHIVLPFCHKIDFIQMLGRKRIMDDELNDNTNIYIQAPTIQKLNQNLFHYNYINKIINRYLNILPPNYWSLIFEEYPITTSRKQYEYFNEEITIFLSRLWENDDNSIKKIFFVDKNRNLLLNPLAIFELDLLMNYLEDLKNNIKKPDYFLNLIKSWLGEKLVLPIASIGFENCYNFEDILIKLESNGGIAEKDFELFYNAFQHFYKIKCSELFAAESDKMNEIKKIKKGKSIRLATMNNQLKALGNPYNQYVIKKEKLHWKLIARR